MRYVLDPGLVAFFGKSGIGYILKQREGVFSYLANNIMIQRVGISPDSHFPKWRMGQDKKFSPMGESEDIQPWRSKT